ncbi:MAG: hypothetical protein ACPGUV_14015 [Polyangiales bacterium]
MLSAVGTCAGMTLPANVARAEAPKDERTRQDRARARALFAEGLSFADTGRWASAADRFERALALIPTAEIRYNLATALSKLGRQLEATELLAEVLASDADAAVKTAAQNMRDKLLPKLGKLRITVRGEGPGQVELDGKAVPPPLLGVAVAADLGPHQASLQVRKRPIDTCTLQVKQDSVAQCNLTYPAPPPAPTKPPPASRRLYKNPWFWLALGAAAATATATSILIARDGANSPANPATLAF